MTPLGRQCLPQRGDYTVSGSLFRGSISYLGSGYPSFVCSSTGAKKNALHEDQNLEAFDNSRDSLSFSPTILSPDSVIPEICFIGRSNCGKSTLINSLLHHATSNKKHSHSQKKRARTSKTAGRTQTAHSFQVSINSKKHRSKLTLIDLPGYGFANAKLSTSLKWRKSVLHYFSTRDSMFLRRIYILLDIRRGLTDVDIDMINDIERMENPKPYQFILTKEDTLSPSMKAVFIEKTVRAINKLKGQNVVPIMNCVSAKSGQGISELQASIVNAIQH